MMKFFAGKEEALSPAIREQSKRVRHALTDGDPQSLPRSRHELGKALHLSAPHPLHPGWPESTPALRLRDGAVVRLRPIQKNDGAAWITQRLKDEGVLRSVEPTVANSWRETHSPRGWRLMYATMRHLAKHGEVVPLAIELDGRFVGQLTLGGIHHGTASECWIGYWVYSAYAGRGIATAACALGTDHALMRVGIHRITATYLPDNPASQAVLERCGYRHEGYLRKNLHIDGRWRDHNLMALVAEDYPDSAALRLRRVGYFR